MSGPVKQCPKCKALSPISAEKCACGHVFRTVFQETDQTRVFVPVGTPATSIVSDTIHMTPGQHNIALAVLASIVPCLPGLGQFVNKQPLKGLVIFFGFWLMLGLCAILGLAFIVFWFVPSIIWIAAIIDAVLIAVRLNRGEPIRTWQFF